MWAVLGVAVLGHAVAGAIALRAQSILDEESKAFVATTHVRGWARAEGGERPAVSLVTRYCSSGSDRDFQGVTVRSGPFTLHRGTESDEGDLWVKIVQDELRGAGVAFKLPGEEPLVLEKATCEVLRFTKWGPDGGILRFDCRRGARRLEGALDFRECDAGWWPDAIVYWRDRGLW
jgi:hypothetical protein